MFIEELLADVQMEGSQIEYKGKLNREDVVGWLKTIAGFANGAGGHMYLGVEDKTHKLIGYERMAADKERNYFNNQVNEHLVPRPPIKIDFLRYIVKKKERFVVRIKVDTSPTRPVILKYQNIPAIYMRRDGFTNGATYEEIIQMSIASQNTQFDALVSDKSYQRSDFGELLNFYAGHNNGKAYTDKALRSLGFFDEKGHLTNGALLFADNYEGPKTNTTCSVFSGFSKGSQRIVTVNRFHGNIIRIIKNICDFIYQRMNHSLLKTPTGRINTDAYPRRAVFEGVVNAVAHRDYFLDGTQIQVDMFRDRLEISSPGSFYRGADIGITYDLSNIISKRRNEIICAVLVACNVMEAAGTGFDKIVEEYATADEKHKPYIHSASDHFTLVLPDLTYIEGFDASNKVKLLYPPISNGTGHDEKILSYCYQRARSAADIAAHLGISDSSYLRSKVLGNLVEQGYLLASQQARTKFYKTNAGIVELG